MEREGEEEFSCCSTAVYMRRGEGSDERCLVVWLHHTLHHQKVWWGHPKRGK